MVKIHSTIFIGIIIGSVSLFSACSKQSPVAPENEPGIFSVKSFNADAELLYRPAQEDSAINVTWTLLYEFQNQPGTIESSAMTFGDTLTEVTTLNNAKPNPTDSLLEFSYNAWVNSEMDSLLFDFGIQGVFWNYDFQSDTFGGFAKTFSWSKNVRLKVRK